MVAGIMLNHHRSATEIMMLTENNTNKENVNKIDTCYKNSVMGRGGASSIPFKILFLCFNKKKWVQTKECVKT